MTQKISSTFLALWSWEQFVDTWQATIGSIPQPLVQQLPVYAPDAIRPSFVAWWPRGKETERWIALQQYILEYPHRDPMLWRPQTPSGQQATIYSLCATSNINEIIGVLTCASLRPYLERSSFENYRNREVFAQINKWARKAAVSALQPWPWHHKSLDVLPNLAYEGQLDDFGTLHSDYAGNDEIVIAIIKHHKALLEAWRPIELLCDETGDVKLIQTIQKRLTEKRAAEEQAHLEQQRREKEQAAEQKRQAEEYQQRHPRAKEWPPSAAVLRELVWSMPTVDVAKLFGVSDVAVGKLCKKLGVPKPRLGFWRKVETGAIKHPNGKAPKSL